MRSRHAILATALLAAWPAAAQMQPRDLGPDGGPPAQQQPQRQAPPPQQAPPQAQAPVGQGPVWQTLETANHGQWTFSALRHAQDGSASCAIHTHWNDTGRQLRIAALENPVTLNIMLNDPRWTLREDASSQGSIQVDARTFTTQFVRIGPTALASRLATGSDSVRNFLNAFRGGNTMRVTLPGDSFVAGLRGSSAAMDAMSRCIATYFGQRPQQAPQQQRPGGK